MCVVLASASVEQDVAQNISPSANKCLMEAITSPLFINTDYQSLCQNPDFRDTLNDCLIRDCTVREFLDFINITNAICKLPLYDHRIDIQATTLTMASLAAVFFVMRLISKLTGTISWGPEDFLITIGMGLVISFTVLIQLMLGTGFGRDMWIFPDDDITQFFKYLLMIEVIYAVALATIKASILFFFLRVFPDRTFRILVYCTLGVNILSTVIILVLGAFQRRPIGLMWEGWQVFQPEGVIFEFNDLVLAHGGMNIALDVWMLVLPLSQLRHLKLKLQKMMGVIAMFSVGTFLTVVSVLRFKFSLTFAESVNITAESRLTIIWSCIELCVGVMVACMPGVRQLVRDIRIRWKESRGVTNEQPEQIFVERPLSTIVVTQNDEPPERTMSKGGHSEYSGTIVDHTGSTTDYSEKGTA